MKLCNLCTELAAVHGSVDGPTRKLLALQRFRPESEGQQTCSGRVRAGASLPQSFAMLTARCAVVGSAVERVGVHR
jgi:hypothetical protein